MMRLFLWLGCCLPTLLMAQLPTLYVEFERANGAPYSLPLTGGLNNPQYSNADLNGDGVDDLVYFDRLGGVVVPIVQTPATSQFVHVPTYAANFPEVKNWMLLRDYNCDGIRDLFAYDYDISNGKVSIGVYNGVRNTQSELSFPALTQRLTYRYGSGGQFFNLFHSNADIPAVDDIDGDGDLDILNFNSTGGYVEYYENQSQEEGYGCDSLIYRLKDNCWGRFYESGLSEVIDLSPRVDSCAKYSAWNPPLRNSQHAGSTLLTIDRDNDGDKELILGDLSFSNLTLLTNGGNRDTAFMVAQEVFFPANSSPVNLEIFPAAFHVQASSDNKRDLLVAPNILGNAEDATTWYYENTGTEAQPVFTFRSEDFLVGDMVDIGTGAAPVLWDYNGDGLIDLLVGNEFKFVSPTDQYSSLYLWENVGTATAPRFRLVDTDYANLKQYQLLRLVPTIGDLNGDGLADLLVGRENGELLLLYNQGTATAPAFNVLQPNYAGIDVGQNASPQLVDADRDGLLDLVIGERNGNTNYFENTGTATAPVFASSPTTATFGFVDARLPGTIEGNASPRLVDVKGRYLLYIGNETGDVWVYDNIENNLTGTFNRVSNPLDNLFQGEETHPAAADLNGDGLLDVVVGNRRGGLSVYGTQTTIAVRQLSTPAWTVTIAPNPSTDYWTVKWSIAPSSGGVLQLYNALGQCIKQQYWAAGEQTLQMDARVLAAGTYWMRLKSVDGEWSQVVLKQ